MAEEPTDEVQVERAGDGLAEEQRLGAGSTERPRGQVVPGGVGDDIGREVILVQHVATPRRRPRR